jgi:chromosome segregation ATPase
MKATPEEVQKLEAKYSQLSMDTSALQEKHDRLISQIATERTAFQKEREKLVSDQNLILKNREMACARADAELQAREKAVIGLEVQFTELRKLSAYIQSQQDQLNNTRRLLNEEIERETKIKANNEVVTAQLWKRQVEVDERERVVAEREMKATVREVELDARIAAQAKTEESLSAIQSALDGRQKKLSEQEEMTSSLEISLRKRSDELDAKQVTLDRAEQAIMAKSVKLNEKEQELNHRSALIKQREFEILGKPSV